MSLLSPDVTHLVGPYGCGAVALAVGIGCAGILFSSETTLRAVATHAGAMHGPGVAGMIAAAAFGAIRSCP